MTENAQPIAVRPWLDELGAGARRLANVAREAVLAPFYSAYRWRLEAARHRMDDPGVVTNAQALMEALAELESAQEEHDAIYERWAALTAKLEG